LTTANQQFISLPKLLEQQLDSPFSITQTSKTTRAELLAHALSLSKQLPNKSFALNLCQNRYLFSVAFLAVVIKQQINLLPPNQTPLTVNGLLGQFQQSYCITDSPYSYSGEHFLLTEDNLKNTGDDLSSIDINKTISISFTSGSTGKPKAIEKTWREFQQGALLAINHLGLHDKQLTLVSTVPPQHMYGLESSLFWPLFSQLCIHSSRPFYPIDIQQTLQSSTQPCLLISTPMHLQACCRTNICWPEVNMVLSSTAPMAHTLAVQVEQCFKAPLWEVFGSTETLSYASRRITKNDKWQPYSGITISRQNNHSFVNGGHLRQAIKLDDRLHIDAKGQFSVLGRSADLIKVAGKRNSLTELNRIINAIPGVDDAVFLQNGTERIAAFVVSQLSTKEILQALKQSLDEVFLPRPLYRVKQLPRNAVGKITRTKLERLLKEINIDKNH
jgi:acyl-coenzyme A synthetase/AMP-(fatty) acid ligase